jgi:hypothetical protein
MFPLREFSEAPKFAKGFPRAVSLHRGLTTKGCVATSTRLLQVIIKKLDELSGGQFTNEYKNNNLSEVEKIIKMAIGRGNLDMTEREEIRKYIDNSHNVY